MEHSRLALPTGRVRLDDDSVISTPAELTDINGVRGCTRLDSPSLSREMSITTLASRRGRRRGAFALLGIWLFALACGIANACAVQSPAKAHAHDHAAHRHAAVAEPGHIATQVPGDRDDAPDDTAQGQAACIKACDESAQSLLKHGKWTPETDSDAVAIPAWPAQPGPKAEPRARFIDSAPSRPSVPIRAWLSRLAR